MRSVRIEEDEGFAVMYRMTQIDPHRGTDRRKGVSIGQIEKRGKYSILSKHPELVAQIYCLFTGLVYVLICEFARTRARCTFDFLNSDIRDFFEMNISLCCVILDARS